jgi:hypothetical protein
MPDNTKIPGPEDRELINRNQPYEVKRWAEKFGVSEARLLQAIDAVGPRVADVRRYLGK